MTGPAERAVASLRSRGRRIATAESLTGGMLCSALVDVPGASDVVAGGVVAYDPSVKTGLLGVDRALVERLGTVHEQTARAMAEAALRRVDGATIAVSTTGVAGPDPSEGHPAGTVFVAVADAEGTVAQRLDLAGDRRSIREETVRAALSLVVARLGEESRG